jgi:hypothetical protein
MYEFERLRVSAFWMGQHGIYLGQHFVRDFLAASFRHGRSSTLHFVSILSRSALSISPFDTRAYIVARTLPCTLCL